MHPESKFQITLNQPSIGKMRVTLWFADTKSWSIFFDVLLFLLSSLATGSSFMSISLLVPELWQLLFTRDLTRNPEIENTPVWVLFNFWRLEKRLTDTKFGMNVSLKVTSVEKCQVYSFYRFWVIKGKPCYNYLIWHV